MWRLPDNFMWRSPDKFSKTTLIPMGFRRKDNMPDANRTRSHEFDKREQFSKGSNRSERQPQVDTFDVWTIVVHTFQAAYQRL